MTAPDLAPATGAPCPRPGCTGTIRPTGFCSACRRRPPAAPAAPADRPVPSPRRAPAPAPAPDPAPAAPEPDRYLDTDSARIRAGSRPGPTGDLDLDGLAVLPLVSPPEDPAQREVPRLPDKGAKECGNPGCHGYIGVSYDGGPPPEEGYCVLCGTPYSFRPKLAPGDVVAGQYEVLGYLTQGGTSWVYLAKDVELPDQRVVLKTQLNTADVTARRQAVEERRSLTSLHHPDLVRIIGSKQHTADGDTEPTDYIVMEYVAGRSLQDLLLMSKDQLAALFGEPFALDHVLTYGCKILGVLRYLHRQDLLYCDMKPANVIHYEREIKVIDLGGVRRTDDMTSTLVFTSGYAPDKDERDRRGFQVDSDLFTVGKTLHQLAMSAVRPTGLAARSFDKLINRAVSKEPARRFTSAQQMSRQAWEVLREHRALSRGERHPERSTRFEPTAAIFGAALGTAPGFDHWTGRPPGAPPPDLDIEPPSPQETARSLPGPIADQDDPAATLLGSLAGDAPERTAQRVRADAGLRTVETALWLCRSYLLRSEPGPDGEEDRGQADHWLAEAVRLMGPDVADYDWRRAWHQGLLHLMRGQVHDAGDRFAAVYDTVPGEWAPKLALGYCEEYLRGRPEVPPPEPETEEQRRAAREKAAADAAWAEQESAAYYEAVWARDRSQTSAAFGLARLKLRQGDRAAAVAVLDEVPSTSRAYDAARIAALRVLAGRPAGAPPSYQDLAAAEERVAELREDDARERLVAEIRENVLGGRRVQDHPPLWRYLLGRRRPDHALPALPEGLLFRGAANLAALAALLNDSLVNLVEKAPPEVRPALLDRANALRPQSWL
jgi:serine/threonine-protein kinase PknG